MDFGSLCLREEGKRNTVNTALYTIFYYIVVIRCTEYIILLEGGTKYMRSLLKSKKRSWMKDKKGVGLVQGLVMGIAGLVIGVIIAFVIVSTLNDASLLTADSAEDNATDQMISNFTTGINNVSNKLPTVLLIAAVVLILGVLALLWAQFKRMQVGGGSEL